MADFKLRHVPLRLTTGAFILNAGIGKLSADPATAGRLHDMAKGTYPALADLEPARFTQVLAVAEIGLGAVLLAPRFPARLAGAALTTFAAGLIGLYFRTPGMRQENSLRPTPQGTALAKDWWLLGAGLALLID